MKLEPPQSEIPSHRVASLQAKKEALRLELQVIELELKVVELKKKRAADAVRIASLESQTQGYPNALGVKREVPQCHMLTPDTDTVNEDDMPESPKEPILVIDSDDEGPENDVIGAEASAVNDLGRAPESPLSATPAQPSAERTSREAPSPVLPDHIPDVEIQPEMNLDGPVPDVVVTKPDLVADAFGGVRAGYFHNFGDPKPGQAATVPFFTFPPARPGQHGLGLFALDGVPVAPRSVNLFVGEKTMEIFTLLHNTMSSAEPEQGHTKSLSPAPGDKGKTKQTSPETEVQQHLEREEERERRDVAAAEERAAAHALAAMSSEERKRVEKEGEQNRKYAEDLQKLEDELAAEEREAATRCARVHEIHTRIELGIATDYEFTEAADLLRRAVSPDGRDVPDEESGSDDLGSDGEMTEWTERTGESGKRMRKAQEAKGERPRKRPRGNAKWENSVEGCKNCRKRRVVCVVAPNTRACVDCKRRKVKCPLLPESSTRRPRVRKERILQASSSRGEAGLSQAGPSRGRAEAFTSRAQVVLGTENVVSGGHFTGVDELRLGLLNTQREFESDEKKAAEEEQQNAEEEESAKKNAELDAAIVEIMAQKAEIAKKLAPKPKKEPQEGTVPPQDPLAVLEGFRLLEGVAGPIYELIDDELVASELGTQPEEKTNE